VNSSSKFSKSLPGEVHLLIDLLLKFVLKGVEAQLDLLWAAAGLIDPRDSLLEIPSDSMVPRTVARPKTPLKS
jgi:hypothetical protein